MEKALQQKEIKDVEYRLKSIFGGSVGNLVEWYDWYTYSALRFIFLLPFSRIVIQPHSY